MKNIAALLGSFIFAVSVLNAQNIGMNKTSPVSPVDIVEPSGVILTDFQPVLNVQYTGTNSQDAVAIKGYSQPVVGKGIGGLFGGGSTAGAFYGGHTGVYSLGYGIDDGVSYGVNAGALQNGAENTTLVGTRGLAGTGTSSINYGAMGEANGGNSNNYGVHGLATGTGSLNFGVYGAATNGTTNWAGFFNQGNVYISNKLAIGQNNPFYPLDILSNQAFARLVSNSSVDGSVVDLRNTTGGSTNLGAINFSDAGATPGQIAYLTNNSLTFRVNNSERMRFTSAGYLGIGLNIPDSPVHINQPAGVTLGAFQAVLNVQYTGTNSQDAVAVKGTSTPTPGKGIGGLFGGGATAGAFYGGHTGIYCLGNGISSGTAYGINADVTNNGAENAIQVASKGYASGSNTTNYGGKLESNGASSTNYGVHGYASGSGSTNYGVYGSAAGGSQNWAGYFNDGHVYIHNNLGIGQTNPTSDLDILSAQAVAKLITNNSANGAVLVLHNTTASPTYLGAVNFGDGNSTVGQVGYLADHNFVIRVNNFERIRISPSGLFGIGRTPTTNRLEVEGAASKSSAGDWLANSDERLKKNISPLSPEQMIEKLLALQGVTYEWNDDKTGTERPEGIQYGFTAQNIQEVFPTLVEEDANGYLQTAYGTYDAMMIEALRYLYQENQLLKNELDEIKELIKEVSSNR